MDPKEDAGYVAATTWQGIALREKEVGEDMEEKQESIKEERRVKEAKDGERDRKEEKDMREAKEEARDQKMDAGSVEEITTQSTVPRTVARGQELWRNTCPSCHH